jgi:Ca-activated chloride channel family protein
VGHTTALCPVGEPLVLSPVVIAMWKPMAEALGWPAKILGWSDLLKVNANPKGWGAFGHPEWGSFKLGHTHPEYSNSGLLSVLAEAYAGAKKTRGLTPDDASRPGTADFIASVEKTIVHYGKSTGFFADKMLQRGPSYLSAAVLYENLVIESYARTQPAMFPIVAVYPKEGTFWSDHPFAVLDAPWVGDDERQAAQQFSTFLRQRASQERALALGFRPADTSIAIASPIDAQHGVDPKQPQTLLEVPDAATLDALLAAWRKNKKAADVMLVFDKSGSMEGKPLAEAKAGAKAFIETLGDRDRVSLLFFDTKVYPPVGPMPLGPNKQSLLARIDGAIAGGGTALYDATLEAYTQTLARSRAEPASLHAVVVMTDGKDEDSKIELEALEKDLRVEGSSVPVRVFTIAYGKQAEAPILARIADAAQGTSAQGNVDNIVEVYRDMASFF